MQIYIFSAIPLRDVAHFSRIQLMHAVHELQATHAHKHSSISFYLWTAYAFYFGSILAQKLKIYWNRNTPWPIQSKSNRLSVLNKSAISTRLIFATSCGCSTGKYDEYFCWTVLIDLNGKIRTCFSRFCYDCCCWSFADRCSNDRVHIFIVVSSALFTFGYFVHVKRTYEYTVLNWNNRTRNLTLFSLSHHMAAFNTQHTRQYSPQARSISSA